MRLARRIRALCRGCAAGCATRACEQRARPAAHRAAEPRLSQYGKFSPKGHCGCGRFATPRLMSCGRPGMEPGQGASLLDRVATQSALDASGPVASSLVRCFEETCFSGLPPGEGSVLLIGLVLDAPDLLPSHVRGGQRSDDASSRKGAGRTAVCASSARSIKTPTRTSCFVLAVRAHRSCDARIGPRPSRQVQRGPMQLRISNLGP